MKVNFNIAIKSLDGQDIPDSNMGKTIGNLLASSNKGDSIKLFHWACDFHNGKEVEIDAADLITLKEFIRGNDQLTNLGKAQALQILEALK